MKLQRIIGVGLVLLLIAGCDVQNGNVSPNEKNLIGTWVPDRQHSNCPPSWMAANVALVIKADGLCEARNFGKGLFERSYTHDQDTSPQGVVNGSWRLRNDGGKWGIAFQWKLVGRTFDYEASLVEISNKTEIEFWIGYPDPYPRLLLQKAGVAGSPGQR